MALLLKVGKLLLNLVEFLSTIYLLYIFYLFWWSTFSYLVPAWDRFLALLPTGALTIYLLRGWFYQIYETLRG